MSLHVTPAERRAHTRLLRDHKTNLPKRIPAPKRERIEQAIEAHLSEVDSLLQVLNLYDGDADYEEDRSDFEYTNGGAGHSSNPWLDDLEADPSDEEPSLAHTLDLNQQQASKNLALCWMEDAEHEHDGREPACEDEGAQCEDEGAQCEDEGSAEWPRAAYS